MKKIAAAFSLQTLGALLLLLFTAGCATHTHTTAYTTPPQELISASGFWAIPANTAVRQEILRTLPQDRITYVRRNGRDFYVFPDVANNQLFVGRTQQYQTYRQLASQHQYATQDIEVAHYATATPTNWAAWGSWDRGGYRVGVMHHYHYHYY